MRSEQVVGESIYTGTAPISEDEIIFLREFFPFGSHSYVRSIDGMVEASNGWIAIVELTVKSN